MITKAEKLWVWVDSRCEHLGIDSIRELERRAGVSYGAISKPKVDQRLPTVELSLRMCKPLMVDFVEFWVNAGVVKIEEPPSGYMADIIKLEQDMATNKTPYTLEVDMRDELIELFTGGEFVPKWQPYVIRQSVIDENKRKINY